jgi:hypothetical protein
MPYTNIDIFREKGEKEPLNFMKKWFKQIIVDFFFCYLIQN